MTRAVAIVDLSEAPVNVHVLTVWAGGHIAEGKSVRQRQRRRFKFTGQDGVKPALFSLDMGAGMVGHKSARHLSRASDLLAGHRAGAGRRRADAGPVLASSGRYPMSWSHSAASRSSASGPSVAAMLRARAATPWTCAQRRGSGRAGVCGRVRLAVRRPYVGFAWVYAGYKAKLDIARKS